MLTLDPLTAAFGFGIGGDSKAARSLRAKMQRRDRYGRFTFMGGGFSFNLRGLDGAFSNFGGRVVGPGINNTVQVEVTGHPTIPNGIYEIPAGKGVSSKAWLPESVEVKDSKSSADLFVDESSLKKLEQPMGWEKQQTEPGTPELWTSRDGYFVQKDGNTLSLHRANLEDNSIGDEVASSDSWADIQKAALNDQDDYAKVLESADAKSKPSILNPPRQESTDDGYDALRDQMLEEGWSKDTGSPGYGQGKSFKKQWSDEISRRAAEADAKRGIEQTWEYKPRDPAKHVGTEGRNQMLIDWANQQSGDFFKSVADQHKKRYGKLTQKQWDALDKSFVKSKDAKTFDGRPKDMTPEEMKQLTDFMEDTKFWTGVTKVYTDGYVDSFSKDSRDAEQFFELINSGEYIETYRWEKYRKYKDRVSSDEILDGGSGENAVRISTMTDNFTPRVAGSPEKNPKKTGQENALRYVNGGWDSIDNIGPGLAGKEYYLSSAEWSLRVADALNDYVDATPDERIPADNLRKAIANIKSAEVAPEVQAEIPTAPEAPEAPTAPEAQVSDVIDFSPAGKIEDGRKFIADAKANKQKIRFMYNNKERIVSPQEIWVNGQTGRINLRAIDSDGTKKNFSLDKITAPEPNVPEVTVPEANAPEAMPDAPDFISPEEGRTVLDDGLSKVESALGDIPDEDLDNLDEQDSEALNKVNDLLDSARDAIDSIDPVGSDTNDLRFDQARADLGEIAEILSESNNGDMQNAGFDLKEKIDEFINLPQIDFGGGRAERASRETEQKSVNEPMVWNGYLNEEITLSERLEKIKDMPLDDLHDDVYEYISSFTYPRDMENVLKKYGVDDLDEDYPKTRKDRADGDDNTQQLKRAIEDVFTEEKARELLTAAAQEDAAEQAPTPTLMPGDDGTPDDADTRNLPTEQDYMDDPAIDAQIKSMDSYLSDEFDGMFETPDGAYKPDIFAIYEPKGKTIEDSADYTDDPEVLAGMFSDQELVLALRDAVLPLDGEDAPGRGALEFSDGPEFVPAEALYWAIDKKSGKGDMSLASIYDMELDPDREMTNADRIAMFEEDSKIDPLGGNEITMPTTRDAEVLKAVDRNKEIGKPTKAQVATDLMLNHKEQNQSIIDIADDLIEKQDDDLGYDSFNLQDTLVKYLPWSVSNDPNEREAFSALWGMMMSLDGGSSNEELTPESLADPEAFRTIIYNSLLQIHGGDDTIAMDSYSELVDNFGGMPEFVAGKESIASGKDDLSSGTTAAAFYRLTATSAKPNQKSIYRSIAVRNDDPLLEKYTTEGSLFGMDARSFTSTNITDGSLSSKLFYPATSGESRIIFEIAPGETKSIDASTISWFVGENEHFSFGNFEVVSVTKQSGLGGNPEYVVKVRNTDTKDVAAPIAEGISYSGIEDWKKVGGQMGSNVGGTFEDPNGNQYYVKIPKSPSHAQNESLASALYREAGIEAVEVNLGFSNGELRTISPLIPNSSTDLQSKLDDAEYMKKLQEGFAVDAWLANWDVAGLTFDNVITDGNGNPVRVDPGGALMWRAQGAPKGKLFGDKVNEIDSLRDPDLNPTSAEVFGSMTDADISDSAAKLAGITPERIDSIVDSIVTDPSEAATLKERLKKRRDDLLKRFAPKDNILNENTPLTVEEDPNAPQPPLDPNDADAMSNYKDALADYEVNKAVSDVWDCPPGGLTAAGDKTCTTPSVDDLIDNVISKVDAVGVVDNSATAEKILDDIIDFIDQVQDEELKPSTKKKAKEIAEEITAIREGLADGSITNDQAIARLNALSDTIPVGGSSDDANTLEVIGESIDDYRRILDGSFEDRPMSKDYPPAGSGKGYAKDKTTFLTIGKRVRNKWGYAGVVDRYDKNSWQVWVTMDIDPSGQFAPGYKKMSFSTKTLDVIPEGGDDSPWIDLPGTPEGKKPKTGVTPTKVPPKGSPGEKYSKEIADKIAKSGKAAKPPKVKAPEGASEVPEVKPEVPSTPETPAAPTVSDPTVSVKGKITETGMPKITVNEPLSFDYTAYKDIPSLTSAIASLSDPDVQFAKVRGSSALFDSGDVEDLEVRVEGIVNEDGKESMRITYKLTSWAGDNLVTSMETEGEWDTKNGIKVPKTAVDPVTGAILIKAAFSQYGETGTTYTAKIGDTLITLRRAKEKKHALHNYVTIDLPYGASDDEIKSAMEVGGITDARPATTTDFTVLAENRLMSIFGSKTDASKNLKQPAVREKTLADIESAYGITPADVYVTVGPGGQIETRIPDAVAQKIAEKTGAKYLIHNFDMGYLASTTAENKGITSMLNLDQREQLLAEGIVDFLVGPRGGGLMATRTRWFNGIPTGGLSSDSDMGTGGADYVFFTPKNDVGYKHKDGVYGDTEAELMFDAAKLYTRLDWYANYMDEFGRRSSENDVIESARVGAYEVMFKKRVGLESLQSMAVSRDVRDNVLVELERRGIKDIHGRPVGEVIVIAGQPNDPTGVGEAAYIPLSVAVKDLDLQKLDYQKTQMYLNSLLEVKYTYPPKTTKVIAATPNLESLLTKDEITGVYWYYNADGTRTAVEPDKVQSIIDSLKNDTGELKTFAPPTGSLTDPFKSAIQRYNSGELTAEELINIMVALQFSVHTWPVLIDVNAYLKSKPELWELFKKTVKGGK
jgi:hypothetical protein